MSTNADFSFFFSFKKAMLEGSSVYADLLDAWAIGLDLPHVFLFAGLCLDLVLRYLLLPIRNAKGFFA